MKPVLLHILYCSTVKTSGTEFSGTDEGESEHLGGLVHLFGSGRTTYYYP